MAGLGFGWGLAETWIPAEFSGVRGLVGSGWGCCYLVIKSGLLVLYGHVPLFNPRFRSRTVGQRGLAAFGASQSQKYLESCAVPLRGLWQCKRACAAKVCVAVEERIRWGRFVAGALARGGRGSAPERTPRI